MPKEFYVRWFENIRLNDIPDVGGKTASLGELHALLAADGGRVPTASRSLPVLIARRSSSLVPGMGCAASFPILTITT